MRAALCLAVVVLSGCTPPDPCARAEALNTGFSTRHAACFAEGTLPGAKFDTGACTNSMPACSSADTQTLQAYFDCVEQLPGCTPGTRAAFNAGFLECTTGMNRLSPGCFVP